MRGRSASTVIPYRVNTMSTCMLITFGRINGQIRKFINRRRTEWGRDRGGGDQGYVKTGGGAGVGGVCNL